MKKLLLSLIILFSFSQLFAQNTPLTFVHLTDTHVGSGTGAEDLRRTVTDINQNDSIQFVVISGDITEFGADAEIQLAKQILDSLNKPWYIIPGNHDGNWSESGANTFKKVFGNETFYFQKGGYYFLGTNCGPNMRMGPGQIFPRPAHADRFRPAGGVLPRQHVDERPATRPHPRGDRGVHGRDFRRHGALAVEDQAHLADAMDFGRARARVRRSDAVVPQRHLHQGEADDRLHDVRGRARLWPDHPKAAAPDAA